MHFESGSEFHYMEDTRPQYWREPPPFDGRSAIRLTWIWVATCRNSNEFWRDPCSLLYIVSISWEPCGTGGDYDRPSHHPANSSSRNRQHCRWGHGWIPSRLGG